ncbi:MAG: hypothetical protein Q7T16_03325 [Candidatus Burarchaeum sp.]|nr:hypothetical protein [Candidatus Burarchaeum sp.]MDO8339663.1 hypothetical protein [Candidatus Burarchaeum sp.]
MKNNPKRGQAAMEFLSTYGWAVLIIALVLAALLWLGVFNVQQGIPERCTFQAGLDCSDVRITVAGTGFGPASLSQITLQNKMTNTIYICQFGCTNDLQSALDDAIVPFVTPSECAQPAATPIAVLQLGQKQTIAPAQLCQDYFASTQSNNLFKSGEVYSGSVVVYYSLAADAGVAGAKARMATGDVYYKVTEG